MSTHQFNTEVSQLLHLIVHSLYSHSEIFIRELVSNSSDALDKLKYLTLTEDAFKNMEWDPRIDIEFDDEDKKWIRVSDNGVGMNEEDLVENLGTIARSGTKRFLEQMSGDSKKDSNLIGQFGVGFYSAFMVADSIEVLTRKAGEDKAWKWTSDGKSDYRIEDAERDSQGTTITMHLNDDGTEFASRWRIQDIIKKYSNHIAFPIYLHYDKVEYDDKGKEKDKTREVEKANSAGAMWKRSKSDLTDEDYKEFYHSIGHDSDDPLFYLHTQAEGTIEYTTLFFVPKTAPFDMYQADYKPGVKLYVRRVFITDDEKELLPTWLRFVRGVIDSEDLPLNVSREILQQNRVMNNIRNASVKKLLGEFSRIAQEEPETYTSFIEQYNRPLKEGLYQDFSHREALLELVRFKSTTEEGWTSLEKYKERMLPDQKAIYYITGGDEKTLRNSPLLEAYRAKNIEVLIMSDELDEIVVPTIGTYKEVDLKPVNRSDAGDDLNDKKDKKKEKEAKPTIKRIQDALGDRVKEVRTSIRLAESASCIVLDEADPSMKMQEILRAMGQQDIPKIKPILEINPDHPLIKQLADADDEKAKDLSHILLDQAYLAEGAQIEEPAEFVKRLNRVLTG